MDFDPDQSDWRHNPWSDAYGMIAMGATHAASQAQRAIQQRPETMLGLLTSKGWFWKVAVAGLCGSITHTLLMFAKAQLGILEAFQPYHSLQITLAYWTGGDVHPVVPWLISYLNGSTAAGVAFFRLYERLPGNSGAIKGLASGVLGWLAMDLIFFPLLGLGPFAMKLGLGLWPALFSLAMMLTYSIVMGAVFGMIDARPDCGGSTD